VEDQSSRRLSKVVCLYQRSTNQAGRHVFVDRPTDDTARVQIHDQRQLHPAFSGLQIGNVTGSHLVFSDGVEVSATPAV